MGICPGRKTCRYELIKDSFLSYQQASDPSGTPMRKPEINGPETAHTQNPKSSHLLGVEWQ